MTGYSIKPKTRKYVNGYGFLPFARKYKNQFLDAGLDASKVVYIAGKKIADAVLSNTLAARTKSKDDNIEKQEPYEENNYSTRKKR